MRYEEILVLATLVCGILYVADKLMKKKRKQAKKQSWLITEMIALFPVLLLVLVLRSFLFEPFRIPTGSMKPTLLEGDFIVVNKYAYGLRLPVSGTVVLPISTPKTGDIIVFRHTDGKDLIKRVIGVPGDKIRYREKQLYINDQIVPHTFIEATQDHGVYTFESKETLGNVIHDIYDYPQTFRDYRFDDVVVPADSYFVMGDNRSNSEDSRVFGFVKDKYILGKATITWLSWDSTEDKILPIRWSRFGKSVYEYKN